MTDQPAGHGPAEEVPDEPVPVFDPRRTRRAVRRGIIRTALTTAVWILVLWSLAYIASVGIQQRGDRVDRMERVLGTAVQVAHPDYRVESSGCCNEGFLSMSLLLDVAPVGPLGWDSSSEPYAVTQNHLGHIEHQRGLPQGPLHFAIQSVNHPQNWNKDGARDLIDRLPQQLTASAAVAFTEPLTPAAWQAFAARNSDTLQTPTAILLTRGETGMPPIGWAELFYPPNPLPEGVDGFKAWVAGLRDSDADNLGQFYLTVEGLRAAAADGRVYGYVIGGTPIANLRALLDDPRVGMVALGEVAFDLTIPDPRTE